MTTPTPPSSQSSGLCGPWVSADEVLARPGCEKLDPGLVAACVGPASEVLWALSGRQFTGAGCTATVRPTARPRGVPAALWAAQFQFGFWPSWGACSGDYPAYGLLPWALAHGDCDRPPEVELGAYPVQQILAVKIDGQLIPPAEYRLDYRRTLIRCRTLDTDEPSVRWGWPTCQDLTLPDDQPGTFSVTYLYGAEPPDGGKLAAAVLAAEYARQAQPGMTSRLPQRLTSLTREGVTAVAIDPMTIIQQGFTTLPEVDLWLRSVNPSKLTRRARVWSPDTQRARRV